MRRVLFLADINSGYTEKWASALSHRGYEVGIVCLHQPEGNWAQKLNISVFPLLKKGVSEKGLRSFFLRNYFQQFRHIRRVLHDFFPDVLHVHYSGSFELLGALAGFRPFVLSFYEASDENKLPVSPVQRQLFRLNLKRADRISSVTHAGHRSLLRFFQRSANVIPLGVDTDLFCQRSGSSFYTSPDYKIVGMVSEGSKAAGIDDMLAAFYMLHQISGYENTRLLLVCDKSNERRSRQLIADLNLSNKVIVVRPQYPEDMAEYYNMMDVMLSLPATSSMGTALMEAMACERPVIATDVPGLKELLEHGRHGFLVPPGSPDRIVETLRYLLDHPEEAHQMGRAARQQILRDYSFSENTLHMEEMYDEAIGTYVQAFL